MRQRLQIQRFHHTKLLENSIKPIHCGSKWYSTETTEDKSTKITAGDVSATKTVTPKRTLKERIINYLSSSKSVCRQKQLKQNLFY